MKNALKRLFLWLLKGIPVINITASISTLSPSERLKGKKIIVTGGGRGLGFYMAKKFVEEGAEVLISGRNIETLKNASKKLNNSPFLQFDMRDVEQIPSFLRQADKLLGGSIDCLINKLRHSFTIILINSWSINS